MLNPNSPHTENLNTPLWHSISSDEAIHKLSTISGLTSDEARERLAQFGKNELPEPPKKSEWIRFILQFKNVLIYVLIVSSIITAWLGDWLDTGVIWAVIFVNAIIGYLQEGKAERALEGLKKMLSLHSVVLRDGHRVDIKSSELVPGDIVLLKAGDKVPADMRLIESRTLKSQEAALTGESLPIEKITSSLDVETVLADRKNILYSGTVITYGTGKAIVFSTGATTELGKISHMLQDVTKIETPLIQKITKFGTILSIFILSVALLLFIYGYFVHGFTLEELFPAVIGLAVAAIPEGLPALMTITLAMGVQKMAKRNAIIRHLPSVETLGSVNLICSDKTGTLTKNEMTVRSVVTSNKVYEVSGEGFNPNGKILEGQTQVLNSTNDMALIALLQTSLWCNDAKIIQDDNLNWTLIGDPTEGALISLSKKHGIDLGTFKREDVLPFNSEHKYMAVLGKNQEGTQKIYVKGAPEKILHLCSHTLSHNGLQKLDRPFWEKHIENLAAEGQRVIAFAYKDHNLPIDELHHKDMPEGLVFLGICGMIDPPSPEVKEAIKNCHSAGITVKMITGDHALTAQNIGQKLNITNEHGAITGAELDALSEEEWHDVVMKYNVFARTTPEHKLKLVTALQKHNLITAMTGDGVNDAPALKRANIGIAMGIKGTEVTKDASEMVLADDNFTSISEAVKLGRTTFENIKKAITFILPTNGAESFIIIFSIITGTSMAITASQILWINMVTAVTLGLALAFEPSERNVMRRPPRGADEPILDKYLLFRVASVSLLLGGITVILYRYLRESGTEINYARTIAVNTLAIGEAFYLLNCRYLRDSVFHKSFFSNIHIFYSIFTLVGLQIFLIYTPFMQKLFGTVAISLEHWGIIALCGLFLFFIIEFEKYIYSTFLSK